MSEKPPSKDEALEALDFIVNVLKEHEKDLDRLISELGTVAGNLGDRGDLSGKVENVEEKIDLIQNQINTLIKQLSTTQHQTQNQTPQLTQAQTTTNQPTTQIKTENNQPKTPNTTPIMLQCKQWQDYQTIATNAQTISFTHKETEKTFETNALKNNHLITYTGELPQTQTLLKTWLSKQLQTPENKIIEGNLTIA